MAGRPGRPTSWTPVQQTRDLSHYKVNRRGEFQDQSRNKVRIRDGHGTFTLESGERRLFDVRQILALEYHGRPRVAYCRLCGMVLEHFITFRDGDRGNLSADNLAVDVNRSGHESQCAAMLFRQVHRGPVPWGSSGYYHPGTHAPECRCLRCGLGFTRQANRRLLSPSGPGAAVIRIDRRDRPLIANGERSEPFSQLA